MIPNLNIGEKVSSLYPMIINIIPITPTNNPIEMSTINIIGKSAIIVPIIETKFMVSFCLTNNLHIKNVAYKINKL